MKIKKLIRKIAPDSLLPESFTEETVVIPVVRMVGPIVPQQGHGPRNKLCLANVAGPLQKAFEMKDTPAVAISINSPGGSPVQSHLIHKRIRQLAEEHGKQVLVFCEDAAASGGYMIALAGDVIVADPSSVIGSIGVISGGFGFVEAIAKLGIERRVYTTGKQKAMLDPFKPENPEHVAHLDDLLQDLFESFKELVRSRRAGRLSESEDILFTGAFWTGNKAADFGLVDELGDMAGYIKERYGEKTRLKLISPPSGIMNVFSSGAVSSRSADPLAQVAAGFTADAVLASLEERALWSRIGL
ncbi:S49 family peptidase [uncultured Cohaesibacter sp.]|uniref:S49 family peptidase n=1 Tax=uncultured Cohaesibacter sp. TaxID=1002546 RepID=UPI002930A9A1|nr:S49 family peptidase [uncultured Cohaesibacter sp.]